MTVAARLEIVRREIDDAARASGRDPADVTLVAVSKKTDARSVVEAIEAGQRVFGENYVNDGIAKMADVGALLEGVEDESPSAVRWHLIGALQSNKAARAARYYDVIESLHSERAARGVSRAMEAGDGRRSVLLQVHLGGPSSRAGVAPSQALPLARQISAMPGLRLDGVMGVAPQGEPAAAAFARLAHILAELRAAALEGAPLEQMSAGMSGDFAEAIAAGATIVRLGSAIFEA